MNMPQAILFKIMPAIKYLVFFFLLYFGLASSSHADSWMAPAEREYYSEKKTRMALVIPAEWDQANKKKTTSAKAKIYKADLNEKKLLWSIDLSNEHAPTNALITEDGNHLITMDNWYGTGYGRDVLAFYDKNGQLKKYSLEEMLSFLTINTDQLGFERYSKYFSHSVSSRMWMAGSFYAFDTHNNDKIFYIWLGWGNYWVAWDISSGEKYKISKQLKEKWINNHRERAIDNITKGLKEQELSWEAVYGMEFLGANRYEDDKGLFEKLLGFPEIQTATSQSEDAGTHHFRAIFNFSIRQKADTILDEWESGKKNDHMKRWYRKKHKYLGNLKGKIILPKKFDSGMIHVFILPEKADPEKWVSREIIHDFRIVYNKYNFSYDFSPTNSNKIFFDINGLAPGKYNLKVVWSIAVGEKKEETFKIKSGDYESSKLVSLKIKASRDLENIVLKCDKQH